MSVRGENKISYTIKHIVTNSERVEEFKSLGWKVLKTEKISYPQDEGGYEKWIDQINYTLVWIQNNPER